MQERQPRYVVFKTFLDNGDPSYFIVDVRRQQNGSTIQKRSKIFDEGGNAV